MLAIIQSDDTAIGTFIEEMNDFRHSMWTGAVLHKLWVFLEVDLYRHKSTQDVQIERCNNRLAFENDPMSLLEEIVAPYCDFCGIWGRWYSNMGIFCSPNVPVLLIDEAVQGKSLLRRRIKSPDQFQHPA